MNRSKIAECTETAYEQLPVTVCVPDMQSPLSFVSYSLGVLSALLMIQEAAKILMVNNDQLREIATKVAFNTMARIGHMYHTHIGHRLGWVGSCRMDGNSRTISYISRRQLLNHKKYHH
jgi:hypothetical protein